MTLSDPKTAAHFNLLVWYAVKAKGAGWSREDVFEWLGEVFGGAVFGDPAWGWAASDARSLADDFMSEASTWA